MADKYFIAPLSNGIVNFFQFIFVWLDKISGNEEQPSSAKDELREYRNNTTLSADNIPNELKSLLPLAVKWGIGDDAVRGDATDAATSSDKQELVSALTGKLSRIDEWIGSFPEGSMPDEAAAFMYMGEAIDEMDLRIQ